MIVSSPYQRQFVSWAVIKRVIFALAGIAIGAFFLWFTLRDISRRELELAVSQINYIWIAVGILMYLASLGARCVRWGILLRATGSVKWRHVVETLLTGFAANYVLPGRLGELFRAEYARRLFDMSRFTSIGTIVVERVCDGVILASALWIGLGFVLSRATLANQTTSWMLGVGAVSSVVFGFAVLFVILSRRIDIRRFGAPEAVAIRWGRLVEGVSSVARGNMLAVVVWSLAVWTLEILALGSIIRSFAEPLSFAQLMLLIALASLSTLVPTAPGYLGTYQFVFAQVFAQFGLAQSTGIVAATAMQLFCFGTVTVLGVIVLLSRGGITILRAFGR